MFVIASAHKVTVRNGGGKWDDFLLQLFPPRSFGLKVAGPPPFSTSEIEPGMVDILVHLLPGQFTNAANGTCTMNSCFCTRKR